MLSIAISVRAWLTALGCLETDDEGDEVLAGLTVSESSFFVRHQLRAASMSGDAERFIFEQLKQRHLAAQRGMCT